MTLIAPWKLYMMRMFVLCLLVLSFMINGCSEEKKPQETAYETPDSGDQISLDDKENHDASVLPAVSNDDTKVTIKPAVPQVTDCLVASVKGPLRSKNFIWTVNGINVQQGPSKRYCLEGAFRDDVISVTVGDNIAGGSASVKVANSLPRIIDTSLEFVSEDGESYLQVAPKVEDADNDYVVLSYQWIINKQVDERYTDNHLPSEAFQKGDEVQVRIIADDGFGMGLTYLSKNVTIPSVPPVIISQPQKAFEAMEYNYQVEATDADNSDLIFKLENAPEGMTIDTATGMIIWPLSEIRPGKYPVKIVVTDPEGNNDTQIFTLSLGERTITETLLE